MIQRLDLSRLTPYLVSIAGLYLLTILFFSPEILENKSLAVEDSKKGGQMAREMSEYKRETGEVTMWTGTMFSGMPVTMIQLKEYFSPLVWFRALQRGIFLSYSAQAFFAYQISMFVLLVCFRANPYWAMAGAMTFGLTSYNLIIIDVGHLWKVYAIASACLVLGGMRLVFSGNRLWGFLLAALGTALELLANHAQITYYLFFVVVIYAITELVFAVREKRLGSFGTSVGVLVLAAVLGLGANIGRLWSMYEYSQHSNRGKVHLTPIQSDEQEVGDTGVGSKSYAFNWSQGVDETLTLLIPYYKGGSSGEKVREDSDLYREISRSQIPQQQKQLFLENAPLYFGTQPSTAGPIYAGAVVCFLFVLGMFYTSTQNRIWMLTGAAVTMMIAWGSNFTTLNYFLFDHFPFFNKFRAVSMSLSLTILILVLGACIGVQKILEEKVTPKELKQLYIAFG
ncbi:MAG: hypothetical protein AAF740_02030, partial [Bacteroidota bacterium]